MNQKPKFSLSSANEPVEIGGEDYEVAEMTAADRDAHMDLMRSRMAFDAEGNPIGITKYEGLQADLLSRSLRKAGASENIRANVIQRWPSGVVEALYKMAQKINRIGEPDKKDEENKVSEFDAAKNA